MPRLTLTKPAVLDLEAAVADLTELSAAAARRMREDVSRRFRDLRMFPELGRRRPEYDEFVAGVRSTAVRPLVILYCLPAPDHVPVLRIIDGRRDLDFLLLPNRVEKDEP
jgi:plasmid stabilization system protein ParE